MVPYKDALSFTNAHASSALPAMSFRYVRVSTGSSALTWPPLILLLSAMSFFGGAPCASAQRFSFGVVGGVSLTSDFGNEVFGIYNQTIIPTLYYSPSKDPIVGPMVELRLPLHLSVEVDGLYRPLNYTSADVLPDGSLNGVSPATVVTWEFPVLAKYKFSARRVKPFAELGPSFRTAGNLNSAAPSNYGGTIGAGVEARLRKLKIAPAVRYTRWAPDHFQFGQPPRSFLNQAEFVVGFSF